MVEDAMSQDKTDLGNSMRCRQYFIAFSVASTGSHILSTKQCGKVEDPELLKPYWMLNLGLLELLVFLACNRPQF
jgi:hypothetical protein